MKALPALTLSGTLFVAACGPYIDGPQLPPPVTTGIFTETSLASVQRGLRQTCEAEGNKFVVQDSSLMGCLIQGFWPEGEGEVMLQFLLDRSNTQVVAQAQLFLPVSADTTLEFYGPDISNSVRIFLVNAGAESVYIIIPI